jgi:hypothetical protein
MNREAYLVKRYMTGGAADETQTTLHKLRRAGLYHAIFSAVKARRRGLTPFTASACSVCPLLNRMLFEAAYQQLQ